MKLNKQSAAVAPAVEDRGIRAYTAAAEAAMRTLGEYYAELAGEVAEATARGELDRVENLRRLLSTNDCCEDCSGRPYGTLTASETAAFALGERVGAQLARRR